MHAHLRPPSLSPPTAFFPLLLQINVYLEAFTSVSSITLGCAFVQMRSQLLIKRRGNKIKKINKSLCVVHCEWSEVKLCLCQIIGDGIIKEGLRPACEENLRGTRAHICLLGVERLNIYRTFFKYLYFFPINSSARNIRRARDNYCITRPIIPPTPARVIRSRDRSPPLWRGLTCLIMRNVGGETHDAQKKIVASDLNNFEKKQVRVYLLAFLCTNTHRRNPHFHLNPASLKSKSAWKCF